MKKTTAAAFAAGMVLCSVTFTACKTEGNSATKGNEDTYTVIADFESWASSFQLMRIMNGFGKVTENNDGAFVRSGKGSAKLQPLGYYAQSSQPYLYFPLYSQKFGRDKTDFSKVKKITASIYCANETGSVEIGLISSVASVSSAERVQNREYKLNRGWNDLVYEVDLNILNIAYDITAMQGVSFAFDNVHSRDLADAPVYYLDDVTICEATEKVDLTDIAELKKYEICDFERLYQDYVVSPAADNPLCTPLLERVGAETGISPSSGAKMLKVVTRPGEKEQSTWPRFTLPEKIVQKAFAALSEEEKSAAYVKFDVFNDGDTPKIFYPEFYSAGGKDWQAFNVIAEPHAWTTFSVPVSKLNARTAALPGYIKIAWAEYLGEEQTFYFDNFRITPDE